MPSRKCNTTDYEQLKLDYDICYDIIISTMTVFVDLLDKKYEGLRKEINTLCTLGMMISNCIAAHINASLDKHEGINFIKMSINDALEEHGYNCEINKNG